MQKIRYNKVHATRRLTIRPYKLSDFKAWHVGVSTRQEPTHPFDVGPLPEEKMTREAFRKMLEHTQSFAQQEKFFVYGVFDRKTGVHVGSLDFFAVGSKEMRWGNLGYQIHNHKNSQGYAKEAAKMGLTIGFDFLNFHRLEAAIKKGHKASVKVATAIGMQKEGMRKKFLPLENDAWADAHIFSMTK